MATKKKAAKTAAPKKTAATRKTSAKKEAKELATVNTDVNYNVDGEHWEKIAKKVEGLKEANQKGKLVGYDWNSIAKPLVDAFEEGQRNQNLYLQINNL